MDDQVEVGDIWVYDNEWHYLIVDLIERTKDGDRVFCDAIDLYKGTVERLLIRDKYAGWKKVA